MATEETGFVDLMGAIEPNALASAITKDAHDRLGEVVVLTCDWLAEDGKELNQIQRVALAANASLLFDGFEHAVRKEILDHVERIRLEKREA